MTGTTHPEQLARDAHAVLTAAAPSEVRQQFLQHLAAGPDAMWRDGPPEHFTASVVLFSADLTHVLLVLHKKARLWLQPGGHFEDQDATVHAAALREATEESGIEGLQVVPGALFLHRHELAAAFGRCRAHLDLRVAAVAPAGARPVVSDESDDVRWWPVQELPTPTDPDLAACIAQLRSAAQQAHAVPSAPHGPTGQSRSAGPSTSAGSSSEASSTGGRPAPNAAPSR